MNDYQKKQREKTIAAVTAAADRLKAKGVKLTIRSIAEEADLSVGAVSKTPVKIYLIQHFRLGEKVQDDDFVIAELKTQIQVLNERLKAERAQVNKMREECKKANNTSNTWELKYRNLLLRYALNIDKTIQSIT